MPRKPKLKREDEVDPEAHEAPEADEAPAAAPDPDEDELTRALRERDEYLTSWQRSQADYQNMRRRMSQELDAHARRSKQPLLSDILLIQDQLEMALSIPAQSEDAQSFRAGIELTRDQLLRTLENEGVRPVPEGGAFDPNLHQAMSTVETDEVEPGTVVETLRRGYTWNDIVLRHAQVRVSAAPAAQAQDPQTPTESEEG